MNKFCPHCNSRLMQHAVYCNNFHCMYSVLPLPALAPIGRTYPVGTMPERRGP